MEFPKIRGIFGTGRSGSSWLGSIIDSHPQVAYRFEPFHRLSQLPDISELRHRLEHEKCDNRDLHTVYQLLLTANPVIERPPFFPKSFSRAFGKTWLRPVACKTQTFKLIYKKIYNAHHAPTIIFKEVTMETMMKNLLACTSIPVVYLVRHPCAVVSSMLSGMKNGNMPTGRQTVLASLLEKHDPSMAEMYCPQLDNMDLLEKETLLWRIDVEKGISASKNYKNALTVIYEILCDDPISISTQVFQHFGLDVSNQTLSYLENFTQNNIKKFHILSELGVQPYFSVNRNPATVKNKWKEELKPEDQKRILKLVEDSEAFQHCATLGSWE